MAEMAIDGGKVLEQLTIKVRFPAFSGVRLRLAAFMVGLAARVSPITIDVEACHTKEPSDEPHSCFSGNTAEGGKIVLSRWPEGYVLRYHGETVWREWV